jgi:hypothetical protein
MSKPGTPGEIDYLNPYSDLRIWLNRLLTNLFSQNNGVITSKHHGALFTKWTGSSQTSLERTWENERKIRATGKFAGTTTTCNAFLGRVVNKIRLAGGLPIKSFSSFDLPKAGGPAWYKYPNEKHTPQPGDFFQLRDVQTGWYKHVGIIYTRTNATHMRAQSGQGGPKMGYDVMKITGPHPFDAELMGWIDIEEFFAGWKKPAGG